MTLQPVIENPVEWCVRGANLGRPFERTLPTTAKSTGINVPKTRCKTSLANWVEPKGLITSCTEKEKLQMTPPVSRFGTSGRFRMGQTGRRLGRPFERASADYHKLMAL
jgi:hypothetical protein